MRGFLPILLMSLGLASGAFAQAARDSVTVSNDPAKAAAVEKHAQELKAREAQSHAQAAKPGATSTHSGKSPKTKKPHTKKKDSSTKPSASTPVPPATK